jgi:phosphate transport system substrate-binding protein
VQSPRFLFRALALVLVLGLAAAACGGGDDDDAGGGDGGGGGGGAINISGSSTVGPVVARASELYFDSGVTEVEITVDSPGTGDGFAAFCAGETDISNASRQIKDEEIAACEESGITYVELEIAYDGLTVMTNPANEAVECLSTADLYALLGAESEDFGNWSDANTLAAELGSTIAPFPDAELFISAPGTESGTYDAFVELALQDIGEARVGEDAESFVRTDFPGNPDDNVIIEGIAGSDTSLGWVGFAFAEENLDRVKEIAIAAESGGECVPPAIETIADGSYPLSRSLYMYVSTEAAGRADVQGFVDYLLGDAYEESVTDPFGNGSGYVVLPDLAPTLAAWSAAKAG